MFSPKYPPITENRMPIKVNLASTAPVGCSKDAEAVCFHSREAERRRTMKATIVHMVDDINPALPRGP